MTARVGIGADVHAFDAERRLVLGGVEIPDHPGLAGHSDADVVAHAVMDALLGAAALGDLGTHFPNDPQWRDASSMDMLRDVVALLREHGWAPNNVDVTVIAERPRLSPYVAEIRTRLAAALQLEESSLSFKSTTSDGLGFTGRGEGVAALAVATIRPLT
ncbi:MAG: 2-C-methyl-D-erythritol 2,4-cyclodiphosphate synthase [Actinomycetota bacterium]|nr:2-C-methyl-D-erythritol 2,4-cyclodiphosphate synthase [Actinomycetota bacterium]